MKWFRFFLGGVFLIAALAKIMASPTIDTLFGSLPSYMQIIVIAGEIILAVWLFIGIYIQAATVASIILLSLFSGAIIVELRKDHPKPCGCLGPVVAQQYDPDRIRRSLTGGLTVDGTLMIGASVIFIGSGRSKKISDEESNKIES